MFTLEQTKNYLRRYQSYTDLIRSPLIWLSMLAAVLYSSWPWGFVLDPTVERTSLASALEAPHHPFSWLFVAMDVLTGAVLVAVGVWQLRKHPHRLARAVVIGYLIFGLLVAVAALTPLVCDPTTQQCGPLLHNSHILIHGLASIASVVFLGAALASVTYHSWRRGASRWVLAALGVVLLAWVVFGLGSVSQMVWHMRDGHDLQNFFITVCSLSIVAVVAALELRPSPAAEASDVVE